MKKTEPKPLPVPDYVQECDVYIYQLGTEQRAIERLTAERDEQLAAIKASFDTEIRRHEQQADRLTGAIQEFCDRAREVLTEDGKRKTVRFSHGEVAWRDRPPSVSLRGVDKIVELCRASKKLRKFLRVEYSINKQAMLADPETAEAIKGVKIASAGEDFYVEPFRPKAADAAAAE